MSKLDQDTQEIGCSRKADAFCRAESATLTTADKSTSEADDEQQKHGSCAATHVRELSGGGSVYQEKSGRWKARIQIKQVRHILGTYATAEDAREALCKKKCELGLKTDAELNLVQRHAYPGKNGRWYTEIRHPTTKARIHLGTFDTADEAREAYISKRREFDLMVPVPKESKQSGSKVESEQSEKTQKRPHVYLNISGRWRTQISNPLTKAKVHLGTFNTAEEAEEAYNRKKQEFDLMFPCVPKRRKLSNKKLDLGLKGDVELTEKNQRQCHVNLKKSGCLQTRMQDPITKDRVDSGTFNTAEEDSCQADAVVKGKSDSACVSEVPTASADGSSPIKADRIEEVGDGMLGAVNNEEMEFSIIDRQGHLLGEYDRLDDELWICNSEEVAT